MRGHGIDGRGDASDGVPGIASQHFPIFDVNWNKYELLSAWA